MNLLERYSLVEVRFISQHGVEVLRGLSFYRRLVLPIYARAKKRRFNL